MEKILKQLTDIVRECETKRLSMEKEQAELNSLRQNLDHQKAEQAEKQKDLDRQSERIKKLNLVTSVLEEAEDIRRRNSETESNLKAREENIKFLQKNFDKTSSLSEADLRRRKREVEREMKTFKKQVLRDIGRTKPLG